MRVRLEKLGEAHAIELRFFWTENKDAVWVVETSENGQTTNSRRFTDDPVAAYKAFHKTVASAQRDGHRLVVDNVVVDVVAANDVVFKSIPELEEAVIRDRTDNDTWSVLVDAWLDAGDPRGMLASVEATLVTDPGEFLLRRQATDKARRQALGSLYGPLGNDGYRAIAKFERGLVSEIRFAAEGQSQGRSLGEIASLLLSHPMCRFIESLSAEASPCDQLIDALSHSRPISLRTLKLSSNTSLAISVLEKATPDLEVLELNMHSGATLKVGELFKLAQLKSLIVRSALGLDSLAAMLKSLETLTNKTSIEIDSTDDDACNELVSSWLKQLPSTALSFRYNRQVARA